MKKPKFRITFNSPVTLGFVFLCFVVTLLGVISGGWITRTFFVTYYAPPDHPLMYLRLFTHVLGHSGFAHFIGNASYLLLLGPMLEEKYGSGQLLEVIGITAFVTGLFNNLFFRNVGLCGASGVVFAFILLSSFTGFKEGEIPLTFILVIVVYLGQQVYEGIAVQDNISNSAHIVGGMVGTVLGYMLNKGEQGQKLT